MRRDQRAAGLGELLFAGEQIALRVEHFQKGRRAVVVAKPCQPRALGLGAERVLLDADLLGQPPAGCQCVGYLPECGLHGFFVMGGISEFGKNRTLSEQVATRDAIVKHFVIYGIVLILD